MQRQVLGLSRKKLAGLIGIDQSSLARWERGEHHPTKKSLKIINAFLNEQSASRS
jgi:DNA-binding transcriptional regulator YiaG